MGGALEGRNLEMRPKEEIDKMIKRCETTYEEISHIISKAVYGIRSEEGKELKEEITNLEMLISVLHFAKFGTHHPDERFSLKRFKSCTMSTRHFGDDSWPLERIYKQSSERLIKIQSEVNGYHNSEEYIYMQKLNTVLGWIFDVLKDCHVGLHFCWRAFPKKLKDDFILKNRERDDYNIPSRIPLEDQAHRALTQLEDVKTEQKLGTKFSFMKGK